MKESLIMYQWLWLYRDPLLIFVINNNLARNSLTPAYGGDINYGIDRLLNHLDENLLEKLN